MANILLGCQVSHYSADEPILIQRVMFFVVVFLSYNAKKKREEKQLQNWYKRVNSSSSHSVVWMTDLSPNPHSPADTWTFTFLSPLSFTFSILRPLHLHSSCLKCCSAFRAAGSWEKMLWQITSSTFNLPPVLLCIRLCRLRHHGWRHGESYLCNQHFTAPILYKSNPLPLNQPIPPTSLFPKQFGTYFEKQPDNIQSFSPSHPFTFNLLCVFSSNPTCTDLLSVSRLVPDAVYSQPSLLEFLNPSHPSSYAPLLLTLDDLEMCWYALHLFTPAMSQLCAVHTLEEAEFND